MLCFIRKAASHRVFPRIALVMKGERLDFSKHSTFATVAKPVEAPKFEIKSAIDVQFPEPPSGFPFVIEDIPGENLIKLKREFAGEKITAEVYNPIVFRDKDSDDTYTNVIVKVSKGSSGRSLDVHFTADCYSIEFEFISFEDGTLNIYNMYNLMAKRDRYKFWREFIRVRGIEDSIGQFLIQYMIKRKDRDFFLFLNKFSKFDVGINCEDEIRINSYGLISHQYSNFTTTESELIKSQSLSHKLVEILEFKIKNKLLSPSLNKKVMPLPADFPFKIHDGPYITLTREFDGEKIEAKVYPRGSLELVVDMQVFKENGKQLKFNVIMSAHNIEIQYIQVKGPATAKTSWIWANRLDNDLVLAYVEFLEIRGINKSYAGFLHDLALTRHKRCCIAILEDMKKLIQEQS